MGGIIKYEAVTYYLNIVDTKEEVTRGKNTTKTKREKEKTLIQNCCD
jgi:hypothetical protein